ncbi:MAG TPA: ribonuclease HII [Stellaceae bacterium]|nr:ribonuclease HII [Stellaceae bacterium]
MPDFEWERRLGGMVAGVDEVGRGPLAGPVVAAAVILDPKRLPKALYKLDDSKKLDARRRDSLAGLLLEAHRDGKLHVAVGAASVVEIDQINILQASFLAMRRAMSSLRVRPDVALVDGNQKPNLPCGRVEALIGGDALSLSIAAASVLAKVARDRTMMRLGGRHVSYGWESNAGYATPYHMDAIRVHGVTIHHRRSFAPVRERLAQLTLPLE